MCFKWYIKTNTQKNLKNVIQIFNLGNINDIFFLNKTCHYKSKCTKIKMPEEQIIIFKELTDKHVLYTIIKPIIS